MKVSYVPANALLRAPFAIALGYATPAYTALRTDFVAGKNELCNGCNFYHIGLRHRRPAQLRDSARHAAARYWKKLLGRVLPSRTVPSATG